jgi:hypothetical protein
MARPDLAASDPVEVTGACHCRAVTFACTLTKGYASARRCTCSLCRQRGAVAVTSTLASFRLLSGAGQLATYRFNTGVAEHYFCATCGIYTHHKRRSNPDELGVNVACIDGVSPFDFRQVVVNDGERHPSDDREHRTHMAGTLIFQPVADA